MSTITSNALAARSNEALWNNVPDEQYRTVQRNRQDDAAAPVSGVQVASLSNTAGKVVEVLTPDAILFGESHGNTPFGPLGRGGNFATISTKNGSVSYFGSQFLAPAPPIPTPFGIAKGSVSVLGTAGARGDEGGIGVAYKLPTPVGDILFFLNARQDAATAGNLLNILQGKARGTQTVSVNFGAAYSASDGAVHLLASSVPGGTFVAGAALELAGVDGWIGAGYRGSATFENGQLKSINISGVDIPVGKIGEVMGNQLQKVRQSPPLLPNGGNTQIASLNDDIQMAFGQSPWDVGFSAIKRDPRGAIEIRGGTVNVLNHGNRAVAVAEPVYELGVKYKALQPGERIRNNAHAGQVVETVLARALAQDKLNEAGGKKTTNYLQALNAFMNPYQLNHGSVQLKNAHDQYEQSPGSQMLTNASRAAQGLRPLPSSALGESKPGDYSVVRDIYSGHYRWKPDLGTPNPLPTPRGGFRLGG